MTTTIEGARDALMGAIKAAWNASAVTQDLELLYGDVHESQPAGFDAAGNAVAYGVVFLTHGFGEQETLGAVGARRFADGGTLTVQVFTPQGDGFALSDRICQVVQDAMRSIRDANGAWVRGGVPSELVAKGVHQQRNVTGIFEYRQVQ